MGRCASFGCKEIGVYKFPKDTVRRKWEKSLRIVKFKCTDHSRLCGKHFKDSDFDTTSKTTGFPLQRKFPKKSAVPSVFRCTSKETSNYISPRMVRSEKRNAKRDLKPPSTVTSETFEDKENELLLSDINNLDFQQEIATEGTFHTEEDNPAKANHLISKSTQTPTLLRLLFSSYKSKNTIKFLVGATPGGLISYCSDGYGGSMSDRQMIEGSDLLDKCDSGDSIMADCGFNVQDLFATKNIGINIPHFLRGKSQLSGVQVKQDRSLAKYRVHIERLIGLSKTFTILKTELNAYYVPLASRIFFLCVMLCNFREGIVNKKK